jgi:hypothetical protein
MAKGGRRTRGAVRALTVTAAARCAFCICIRIRICICICIYACVRRHIHVLRRPEHLLA